MEPQERGRGEGKEEGRGERRIMAELLTTPWIAKEDFLYQCAGVGTTAATLTHTHAHTHTHRAATWEHVWDRVAAASHGTQVEQVCASIQTHVGRKKLLEE